jgi:hypothetical protein
MYNHYTHYSLCLHNILIRARYILVYWDRVITDHVTAHIYIQVQHCTVQTLLQVTTHLCIQVHYYTVQPVPNIGLNNIMISLKRIHAPGYRHLNHQAHLDTKVDHTTSRN